MNNLPLSVTLQLTEACNLRCKMCYYWGENGCYSNTTINRKPAVLEFEIIKGIVEELKSQKPLYSLFGGEPLTHPQLEDVIKLIKNAGSIVDTPTNGTLLKENASMLIKTGFDNVRVSIDGPREINDIQRGKGSYDKAMEGIKILHEKKKKIGSKKPIISIIYTITPLNHLHVEDFFLNALQLETVDWITIQMQNFITEEMGLEYASYLKKEFGITSNEYWKGMVVNPIDFSTMNMEELSRQVSNVVNYYINSGKNVLLLPPTFSPGNLRAYCQAKWNEMKDQYENCPSPWKSVDITARGDVAPCHVFYDLTMGNLHHKSLKEIWNSENYEKFRKSIQNDGLMSICNIGCCILYLSGKKMRKSKRKRFYS